MRTAIFPFRAIINILVSPTILSVLSIFKTILMIWWPSRFLFYWTISDHLDVIISKLWSTKSWHHIQEFLHFIYNWLRFNLFTFQLRCNSFIPSNFWSIFVIMSWEATKRWYSWHSDMHAIGVVALIERLNLLHSLHTW